MKTKNVKTHSPNNNELPPPKLPLPAKENTTESNLAPKPGGIRAKLMARLAQSANGRAVDGLSSKGLIKRINARSRDVVLAFVSLGRELDTYYKHPLVSELTVEEVDEEPIDINWLTTTTLRLIAQNPAITQPRNAAFLPPSLEILGLLARVRPDLLENAFKRKLVHPGITAKEAKGFVLGQMFDGYV